MYTLTRLRDGSSINRRLMNPIHSQYTAPALHQGLSLFEELSVAPRWRQSSAKAPRRLHEVTMVAPRATTETPRRPRERSMMPSRRIHFMDTPAPPRLLHGAFVEPSWSLRGAFAEPLRSLHQINKPPMQPQLPKGRFHSESVIPAAQPCVISMFGLGLGLGLELRLCKNMFTAPPRRHHGCFTEPSRSRRKFVK